MSEESGWIELWILSVGRRVCAVLGGLAVLAIVFGALALLGAAGYWIGYRPHEPAPPPALVPPAPVTLDLARTFAGPDFQFSQMGQTVPRVDGSVLTRAAVIKDLFPEPQYVWDETYEDFCRVKTSFGCMERGRRVTRLGVGRFIGAFLSQIQEGDRDNETAELRRLLKDAPIEQRANLVAPILVAGAKHRAEQKAQEEARDAEINRRQTDYEAQMSAYHDRLIVIVTVGGFGIGYGFAVALGLCMVVAILAIERHLRRPSPVP